MAYYKLAAGIIRARENYSYFYYCYYCYCSCLDSLILNYHCALLFSFYNFTFLYHDLNIKNFMIRMMIDAVLSSFLSYQFYLFPFFFFIFIFLFMFELCIFDEEINLFFLLFFFFYFSYLFFNVSFLISYLR